MGRSTSSSPLLVTTLTVYLDSYYLTNLPKLQSVKADVDPHCVFTYPQAIPPAGGCRG